MPLDCPEADRPEFAPRAAEMPSTPKSVALAFFNADPGLVFLLEDFRAAYTAYAGLSGTSLPSFTPVKLGEGRISQNPDAIVLAAKRGEVDTAALSALANMAESGTRLYAIIETSGTDPEDARVTLASLQDAARELSLAWGGAAVLATADKTAELCDSPRMGALRRPFSEAIDKLVGAVRMGCSIRQAQQLGGADVSGFDRDGAVMAKPALPAPLWRLATRIFC